MHDDRQPVLPTACPRRATRSFRSAANSGLLVLTLCVSACVEARLPPSAPSTATIPPPSAAEKPVYVQTGLATYYESTGQSGVTASGEIYNAAALTAAHRSLPFGTVIRVTSLSTGRMIKVRINDRGPFVQGRMLDLSVSAASSLGMTRAGKTRVHIEEFASDQP